MINPLQARANGCRQIYNPETNRTYSVCGEILAKYDNLGGPNGFLGLPTSDEITNPDGVGKRVVFENDSSIYWHPRTGAYQIGGAIGARWGELGYEDGPLGYPTTDELTNPDGVGKRNSFEGGMVYWHQATGAWEVWGSILTIWANSGYEESNWGYPTGPEVGPGPTPEAPPSYGGFSQPFHNGTIYWNIVPPVCGPHKPDGVHESHTTPGVMNVHGGIHRGDRCNRRVRTLSFEMKLYDHGWEGLPDPAGSVVVDWTGQELDGHNAAFHVSNVVAGACVDRKMMRADLRGVLIDYDGISYALEEVEGPVSTIRCG